jgi:hypothetical protein
MRSTDTAQHGLAPAKMNLQAKPLFEALAMTQSRCDPCIPRDGVQARRLLTELDPAGPATIQNDTHIATQFEMDWPDERRSIFEIAAAWTTTCKSTDKPEQNYPEICRIFYSTRTATSCRQWVEQSSRLPRRASRPAPPWVWMRNDRPVYGPAHKRPIMMSCINMIVTGN